MDVTIKMYAMYKHNLITETYSQDLKEMIEIFGKKKEACAESFFVVVT